MKSTEQILQTNLRVHKNSNAEANMSVEVENVVEPWEHVRERNDPEHLEASQAEPGSSNPWYHPAGMGHFKVHGKWVEFWDHEIPSYGTNTVYVRLDLETARAYLREHQYMVDICQQAVADLEREEQHGKDGPQGREQDSSGGSADSSQDPPGGV